VHHGPLGQTDHVIVRDRPVVRVEHTALSQGDGVPLVLRIGELYLISGLERAAPAKTHGEQAIGARPRRPPAAIAAAASPAVRPWAAMDRPRRTGRAPRRRDLIEVAHAHTGADPRRPGPAAPAGARGRRRDHARLRRPRDRAVPPGDPRPLLPSP